MLHVILLECAIELVPRELTSLKEIQANARRRRKKPGQLMLDQTHHGRAMTRLDGKEQRGRPDITFLSLLSILETPLCKAGLLTVHLHLLDGRVIEINPDVRLPRNYDRFIGLFEQLLMNGRIPPEGEPLAKIIDTSLPDLIRDLAAGSSESLVLLAIEGGTKTSAESLRNILPQDSSVHVILGVGAFPHGDMPDSVRDLFSTHLELDKEVMMAWHVCAEVLWAYSSRVGIIGRW
ncbi:MAG: 16S rRNA methyltransferase [Candidatus Thorarchaeota archaeon]|nr:16S rRNA methyltransferase [Candidatus Thorarchaeota archaeon]